MAYVEESRVGFAEKPGTTEQEEIHGGVKHEETAHEAAERGHAATDQ